MEYLNGGSVEDLIKASKKAGKKIDSATGSRIIKFILEAVAYIHSYDTAHRDLKPGKCTVTEENIMFAKKNDVDSLKLIDFGLSGKYESTNILSERCGTGIYMAPEVFTDYQYTKVVFLGR